MAFDFNEAREIVEAAKKRGMIRAEGDAPLPPRPERAEKQPGDAVLPDWLQESVRDPTPPKGFSSEEDRSSSR